MSKLIVPRDLSCFATCRRGCSCTEDAQCQVKAAAVSRWYIPEVWQTCAGCCDLDEARVISPINMSRCVAGEEE